MCAQTQSYYIGRIDRINKTLIKNSVLRNTWIYDRKYKLYKAHDIDQEKALWVLYNSDKSSIKNKNSLYNGYVWYAAYIAYYEYMKNTDRVIEFNDILSGCLEILLKCIENYDITYENKNGSASFYTYYIKAVHNLLYAILASLKCEKLSSRSTFSRFNAVLSFMYYFDEEITDIIKMSEEEYICKYGKKFSKNNFIKLYNFMNAVYSLDDDSSLETDDDGIDLQIKLKSECAQLNKYNNDVCDEMFIKEMYYKIISFIMKNNKSKNKKRNATILYKYLMGYNYSEISEILQLGVSRQRIHQIVSNGLQRVRKNINKILTDEEIEEIKSLLR